MSDYQNIIDSFTDTQRDAVFGTLYAAGQSYVSAQETEAFGFHVKDLQNTTGNIEQVTGFRFGFDEMHHFVSSPEFEAAFKQYLDDEELTLDNVDETLRAIRSQTNFTTLEASPLPAPGNTPAPL